ncbi:MULTISPECIES: DUF1871 family protein [unclassified Sporosarcina]|uniref:DUF1871 family protein n=1 Tax=unclassified Sporosarcina TaxID=2647733 RepID=UPI00203F5496|nr:MULTISPECIES: DUF1871 family protein [unclassified Sporosarcina]GKV66596.1 hypothetical protein NCCP2331_27490 [Sporosarcina sp. NCCP-2331]GLB56932.1 hypothetical protein NCCP2378_27190 [Sporosarcina sp. NCCP-2378]
MQTVEMNKRAAMLLKQWDPFGAGAEAYELEITDVLSSLQHIDHPTDLAKCIREVYEHSYEIWIPLENCMDISYKLLAVKYKAKCIV